MQSRFLELLRCPRCRAERPFDLAVEHEDDREVRAGTLTCGSCGHVARVDEGIVDLLPDAPEFVRREAAGLERFAQHMSDEGWDRERVLRLPYEQSGYWFAQGAAMEHLLATVELAPGSTLLDVGSNTCWAANIFAERGLSVVALDIATAAMQGLRTADWWFEARGTYFERILSVMFDPALASESFDYVFCAEVLHHNDADNLRRTLVELHRLLKPGGKLLAINEPLRFVGRSYADHAAEVAEYEGYEHIYSKREYLRAARDAGFEIELMRPNNTPFFRNEDFVLSHRANARETVFTAAKQLVRQSPRARRLYTEWKYLRGPDVSLALIGTKRA